LRDGAAAHAYGPEPVLVALVVLLGKGGEEVVVEAVDEEAAAIVEPVRGVVGAAGEEAELVGGAGDDDGVLVIAEQRPWPCLGWHSAGGIIVVGIIGEHARGEPELAFVIHALDR